MTAPGDMKNNLKILQNEVRHMKYPDELDLNDTMKGKPQAFLPLYNHAFTNYSPDFTAEVVQLLDDGLYGKSDLRFMEAVYRVLRDLFNYKPSITKDQFFSTTGFAERKVMMCADVLKLIRERCRNYGPYRPSNPGIKVSAVIDNRRTSKGVSKQSLDSLVAREPSPNSMSRKVAARPQTAPSLSQNGLSQGTNNVSAKGAAGMGGDECGHVTRAAKTPPPPRTPRSNKSVEVVNMPSRDTEAGQMRVVDVLAKTPDHLISEPHFPHDHMDTMETILSKVRDLPSQLASFMQAVEKRLHKVEERLQYVEEKAKEKQTSVSVDEMGRETHEELRQQMETLRSRLILLENRVTLAESKTQDLKETSHPALAHEKFETDAPSMERGGNALQDIKKHLADNSFASSLLKTFSPIRCEGMVFGTPNDTFANISDTDPRRSSTPTQPISSNHSLIRGRRSDEDVGEGGEPAPSDLSLSFRNFGLDANTQQQVDRIKGMLQSTKLLLPNPSPETATHGNA